ncbi:transaldolase family protein [Amycolatopsis sp. NPDC021455]|uniref:transaldolase family protein n=1 Tax=Amycolatopsis sp. NPDC021455 TaxID=3154901 RepID=UPI0033DBF909
MAEAENDGIRRLAAEGVSPWLDGTSQELLRSSRLMSLIEEGVLRGVTSNVDTLSAAVADDWHYRERLKSLAERKVSAELAVRSLSAYDARLACAELRPQFETGGQLDGCVSIDLGPVPAGDVEPAVREAVELSRLVNRPNLLVKIRAAEQTLHVIRKCLGAGIGVHVSDIVSVRRYRDVLDAGFDGLELAADIGLPLPRIGMVTSLPVGRIDAEFDARLDVVGTTAARALRGQGSLAIARLAYGVYDRRLGTDRWRALRGAGARPPRLMWTDTAMSDPARPATWYADEFVAWGTASAMSPATLDAVGRGSKLHGDTLTGQDDQASAVLAEFERLGVSGSAVADRLDSTTARRHAHAWRKLRDQVSVQLHAAGWTPH